MKWLFLSWSKLHWRINKWRFCLKRLSSSLKSFLVDQRLLKNRCSSDFIWELGRTYSLFNILRVSRVGTWLTVHRLLESNTEAVRAPYGVRASAYWYSAHSELYYWRNKSFKQAQHFQPSFGLFRCAASGQNTAASCRGNNDLCPVPNSSESLNMVSFEIL